ncbi:MAG: type III-A CRISPR-associated protein Csm2 [Bryobacteraceae bacterium]
MNELEPQQTPQETVAAEKTEAAAPAEGAAEAAGGAPAVEVPPAVGETTAEPQTAAGEAAVGGAPAVAAEAPKQEAPAKPAAVASPPRQPRPQPQEKPPRRQAQERNEQRKTVREAGRPERRGPEGPVEIDLEKLMADSLYLDNQAHAIVARMREMDSGTRSQLRRLFSAVRRACRTQEAERQHAFVMLRARLAYTIARHQLRSLDPLEKLLLQVTRKNDARGYERFRDLFEAIVAYNE